MSVMPILGMIVPNMGKLRAVLSKGFSILGPLLVCFSTVMKGFRYSVAF